MASANHDPQHEAGAAVRVTEWWRWTVVAAYLALIYALSAQSKLPDVPGASSDKLQHFLGYALMSVLVVWAAVRGDWRRVRFRTVLFATAFCVLYGWSDELHQRRVPGREFDLHDLAADGAGAFLAGAVSWAWGIIARGRMPAHDV
jgi:VanZ family protein